MRKNAYYVIFILFSFIFFIYLFPSPPWRDSEARNERRGGGGGGGGEDSSLPFNFPHPPETMNDQLPYHYYEEERLYQREGEVERELRERELALISQAKEMALSNLKKSLSTPVFVSGRYRWLPGGVEHDLLYREGVSKVTKRVILFQRLSEAEVIRVIDVQEVKPIHIVLSLKGRLDKYTTFLHHISTTVLPHDPHITLTVAYFDPDITTLRNITGTYLAAFPGLQWSVVPLGEASGEGSGPQGFSRGRGLHTAALKATKNEEDVIFFCDVDVVMEVEFLQRCRANVVYRRQVYYPMVFSLYNPELVYTLQDQPVPDTPAQLRVGEDTGFWREFGFGMSCVARGDYEAAGGYLDYKAWGGEDEALYQKFLELDYLKVIRAPDPSLFHLYHEKQCVGSGGDAAYVACLRSAANTEGSRLQLGLMLLKLHRGTDLEGVLSKRFYYFWLIPYLAALLLLSLLTNALQAWQLLASVRRKHGCKII